VLGTGPGGRIVHKDVVAFGERPRTEAARTPLTATQRTIARRMAESRRDIPEFTLVSEVDMTATVEARAQIGDGTAPVSLNDFVVLAVARALRAHPDVNASFEEGGIVRHEDVNVGVAVATDDALLVPTIFGADRLTLFEVAAASREAVERARSRRSSADDLSGATFTVSNLGMFGVTSFTAVINPPQAAILAVGAVRVLPRFDAAGRVVPRHLAELSLSCDHRVVYGAGAARFLGEVKALLESPIGLLVPPAAHPMKGTP
jgi:pyruvate dehydrogenase E2 component (dihydrolipoamide acetyltransferase)